MAKRNFVFVTALCMSVFGCAEDAEDAEVVEGELNFEGSRPFTGSAKGVFSTPKQVNDNPPTLHFVAQGEGKADPIGAFQITIPHSFTASDGRLTGQDYITPKISPRGEDMIILELDGKCTYTSETTGFCDATGTVTGGTGLFLTASGSIQIHVEADFTALTFTSTYNGTLSR